MNLAKKSQFHFSFFKVDSQNPKFNLEYLQHKGKLLWRTLKSPQLGNTSPTSGLTNTTLFRKTNIKDLPFMRRISKISSDTL